MMKRIEKLRQLALQQTPCFDEFYYRFYKAIGADTQELTYENYAAAYRAAFSQLSVEISEGELIVGKICTRLTEDERKEWNDVIAHTVGRFSEKTACGQDSHLSIDYDRLLKKGITGIKEQISGLLSTCKSEQKAFYLACSACLDSIVIHAENYANLAEKMAGEEGNEERAAELKEIASICRKVPLYPAQTFHEAIQSVNFITYALTLNPMRYRCTQYQLGHPDRYLYDYYVNDLKAGRLTRERAQLLLDCMGIQMNMRVPNGLSNGYMVGGTDGEGNLVANELTEMCMQVVDDVKLVYPAVGLCYTPTLPDRYLEKACEILLHGRSHPAIFNDDTIVKGLKSYGVPEREAHHYIHSTCVEITPVGSAYTWVASPYMNMAQLLLDTFDGTYESFDAHLATLFDLLDRRIKENYEAQCRDREIRKIYGMDPVLSCFIDDCLALGLDAEKGGARYRWIMPSFVGVANLVDSLYALKDTVYDRKEFSLADFRRILEADFQGYEPLRQRLMNELPKYGNDNDEIDGYFDRIIRHIVDVCEKYTNESIGDTLIPSVFCWIMHERFGSQTGATPDGRRAGFPLGDGSGACQGREMKGPTASILSATKWDHHRLIGGVAVNMKFSKSMLGEHSLPILKALIKTYMERGGFEIQINVTDKELLEKARANPEAYRDLVVRIGGYSDYFIKLSPQMQDEVILRTEHTL